MTEMAGGAREWNRVRLDGVRTTWSLCSISLLSMCAAGHSVTKEKTCQYRIRPLPCMSACCPVIRSIDQRDSPMRTTKSSVSQSIKAHGNTGFPYSSTCRSIPFPDGASPVNDSPVDAEGFVADILIVA
jgi:hypothetical protein